MTDLWLTLFVKATVVTATAALAAVTLRHASAAARHLVWVAAIAALLLLPAGALLPESPIDVPLVAHAGSALGAVAAGPSRTAVPLFLWIAGCTLLTARLVASGITIAALLRRGRRDGDGLLIAPGVSTPLACGFRRQLVVLPPAFRAWPDDRRRAVLLHETAHLVRRDCWSLLLAELACALYWPNPLVWYARYRMRREQEHAADDAVLRAGIDPAQYAEHLLAIATAERAPLLIAGAATRSELASRVEAILNPKRRRSMLTKRMVLACAAALLLLGLPVAALQSGRKTYRVGEEGVTSPVVKYKVEPPYTAEAKAAGIQGSVLLSVTVETDGNVYDVSVVRGLDTGLDANAVAALSSWKFKPGEKDGAPVPVKARVEVNYRLK